MRSKSRKIITLSAVFVVGIGVIGYSQLRTRPPAPGVPNPNNPRPKKPVYTSSWLGNTFGTPDTAIQQSIDGIAVTTDGRVFTNSAWDEGGREAGIYQDGKLIGSAQYTHGWGCGGGRTLAMNSRYLFLAMRMDSQGGQLVDRNTWPAKGLWWFGVSRRPINRPSSPASFDAGMGGRGDTLQKSFAVINEVPEGTNAEIAGLAASADRLYMSNPYTDSIEVYDPNSMIRLGGIHVERPGKMAIDSRGMLWVIQTAGSGKSPRIIHISASGQEVSSSINEVTDPRDIALNAEGQLLVAEAGPNQQILIYNVNTDPPARVGVLGVEGGVYATPRGQTGDSRLDFPHAIGADAAGNIYVAGGLNGTDLRKFSPDGNLKWQVLGLQFVDTVAADPTSDGRDVFSKFNRFSIDYTLPTGREWSWKATTIDPFRFPNDPRISTTFPERHYCDRGALSGWPEVSFPRGQSNAFLIYRFRRRNRPPSVIFGSKSTTGCPACTAKAALSGAT